MPRKRRKKNAGGYLHGPSHEHGGIAANVGGNTPVELEGGEYIINAQTTAAVGTEFLDQLNSTQTSYHTGGFNQGQLPSPSNYKRGGKIGRKKMRRGGRPTARKAMRRGGRPTARKAMRRGGRPVARKAMRRGGRPVARKAMRRGGRPPVRRMETGGHTHLYNDLGGVALHRHYSDGSGTGLEGTVGSVPVSTWPGDGPGGDASHEPLLIEPWQLDTTFPYDFMPDPSLHTHPYQLAGLEAPRRKRGGKIRRKTMRRGGRPVARKMRRGGRPVARKMRRGGRPVARKMRRGGRSTTRRFQAGGGVGTCPGGNYGVDAYGNNICV